MPKDEVFSNASRGSQFKDPHVFPFVVKGFKEPDDVRFESRRDLTEAKQTADRFMSEGYDTYIFKVTLVVEQLAHVAMLDEL